MKLIKEMEVSTGHRLHMHKGGCSNLHGHNYQIKIIVDFELNGYIREPFDVGYFIDFSDIKSIINENFDHKFLMYAKDPFASKLIDFLGVTPTSYIPTAENIATDMASLVKTKILAELKKKNEKIPVKVFIILNETKNSKVIAQA